MTETRKVCVVTGSRAEYGLLYWIMKEIASAPGLELQIISTGMHLSPEFGVTFNEIEQDGFNINFKVEMLLSSDSEVGISKSMGLGMIGFADALDQLRPDLLLVLGDRFEVFSAVSTAMISRIPIAHIHGGEATEGVIDEAMRHSITKMSHLHFTSTKEYRRRVIQLGENPGRVFSVGAAGLDNIRYLKLLSKEDVEKSIQFKLGPKNILVTFHPVTLDSEMAGEHFNNLLAELAQLRETRIIFTKVNADTGGRIINEMIDQFVEKHPMNSVSFISLGQINYLSTMQYMDGIVGNSSSGLIEAPSLKVGTVNIGDRQKGRIRAESVIDCEPDLNSISKALAELFSSRFRNRVGQVTNPYDGGGMVAEKIVKILQTFPLDEIIKKSFYDVPYPEENP